MNNWLVWLLSFILPRRKWYRNYYLWSRHWRKTSSSYRIAGIGKCPKCKRQNQPLDTHHKIYYRPVRFFAWKFYRSVLWHERPEDLQVLCRTCHNKEHERN